MDFDQVLEEIGEFGSYQRRNYFLICLPVLFAAANSLSYVFTAGIPNYRCFVPECDNHTKPVYNEIWVPSILPGTMDVNGYFTPKQCSRFASAIENDTNILSNQCSSSMFGNNEETCNEWVFDDYERTIVQDWKITCFDNQWKLAFVGTMHFAGLIVGTASAGILADKFGRKAVFTICIIFMSITGVLQGVAWDYASFLVFAFLNAIGTSGVYPLAFILGVEMVGLRKREMSSVVLNYFYAVGEAAVGLIAWLSHDWKILQFALSAPPILFALYYWIIPESVRWLLAREEHDKALKIIRKAAKINGTELSHEMLSCFEKKETDEFEPEQKANKMYLTTKSIEKDIKKNEMLRTFKEAMQSKIMLTRLAVLLYVWLANAFVYYGLSLNSTSLSGNKYINFSLVCLIEIPGYTLAWIAMNKIGRRWSLAGSLLLCAITCVAGGFIADDAVDLGLTWALITLFLIGKLGITSSFTVIFVHTAEMLPTIIRSGGVGSMSTVGRFGAMIATFVPLLGNYYKPLPLLLFGCVSLVGSMLSLILPETFHRKLPDTVEEAELLGKEKVIST